jgi:hypothetical protein
MRAIGPGDGRIMIHLLSREWEVGGLLGGVMVLHVWYPCVVEDTEGEPKLSIVRSQDPT